jgi:hypothetical protein
MDIISSIYAEVKPAPFRREWPKRPEAEKDRARFLVERLTRMPQYREDPVTLQQIDSHDAVRRELRELQRRQGARLRDADLPREVVAAPHPERGTPPVEMLRGWDERDAALKFWHRAYCA